MLLSPRSAITSAKARRANSILGREFARRLFRREAFDRDDHAACCWFAVPVLANLDLLQAADELLARRTVLGKFDRHNKVAVCVALNFNLHVCRCGQRRVTARPSGLNSAMVDQYNTAFEFILQRGGGANIPGHIVGLVL
jgi:hypothetical protein